MASELKVDKFTGVTTAGSIDVTGEGNSTTTNLQQGLSKAWGYLDGTGTISLQDSFNVGSVTDNSAAVYTFTFSNNFDNINFCWAGICGNQAGNAANMSTPGGANTTSTLKIKNWIYNGALLDRDTNNVMVSGDLA